MQFTIVQAQYNVGQEPVTIVTQHPLGLTLAILISGCVAGAAS